MLRNLAALEVKIENRMIQLICDNDCPLAYVKEALFQYQKYVGHIEDQVKAQQEKADCEKANEQSPTEEKVCQ